MYHVKDEKPLNLHVLDEPAERHLTKGQWSPEADRLM